MNKVKVNICGINYSIITDNDTDFVMDIASKLDRNIRETKKNNPGMSKESAAVFCALEAYEERKKTEDSMDNLRVSLKDYVDENGKLRDSRDNIAREADSLRRKLEKIENSVLSEDKDESSPYDDVEQLVLENTVTPAVTIPVNPPKEREALPPKPNRAERRRQNKNKE